MWDVEVISGSKTNVYTYKYTYYGSQFEKEGKMIVQTLFLKSTSELTSFMSYSCNKQTYGGKSFVS